MEKFIFVFDEQTKNRLLSSGYVLIQECHGQIYVFENNTKLQFNFDDVKHIFTNRMFA